MPAKGGKNARKRKKGTNDIKRELIKKEEGQEYAYVTKMLGNRRLEGSCLDGKIRQCHIRGTMRKRVWINVGDLILIGLRDFQDEKADVIHKYDSDEVRKLKGLGELDTEDKGLDGIVFENEEDDCAFDFDDI